MSASLISNRNVLYATASIRSLATGMIGVMLGIYLARLRFTPGEIGGVIGAGLAGAALAALVVTYAGDRMGRRRTLLWLAMLSALGGLGAAFVSTAAMMAAVAFLGMLNGMGRDRGASLVLEQAILPATVPDAARTYSFAWYNVLMDSGNAVGSLLAGLPALLPRISGLDAVAAFRVSVMLYAALMLLPAFLYSRLSPQAERPAEHLTVPISPQSRRILWKISALFAVDSVSGGFIGTALLAYFFYQRFGAGEGVIAFLFLIARGANALSHLGAAWLAKRIGLVNTMVFTHIPSSLLLMTVPFAPNIWVAALFFLLRESLVEMDVPARQSYVMAVVRPEERTFASGVTHLVRLGGWAVAPSFAGLLMQQLALATPIFIGAALKITYDVLLYFSFRKIRPPEEIGGQMPKQQPANPTVQDET